ncbi:cytosine-specific methyltransferase [Erwinia rhapontici]|uniref:DNA cytosine methyltransferase n=1 Tax=Erwinia rhapontici TaxID=55212 RepID=UPI001BB3A9B1|nr:DNA cytosine methyltransferase [Erwinia rhapontici]BCQ37467.1 cytosine-specific methyltransferase [Erwinia rhapontici]
MLNSIDLFCGGGGLSEGLKQAGFNVLSAVEFDSVAAETFRANNPTTHLVERDIRHVAGNEILNITGLKKGALDLLAGCPPCQGFSSLTRKYDPNDKRNSLIAEVSRLIKELEPKALMIENVPGIISKGSNFLNLFLDEIKQLGYIANYAVLQVADYGVPQDRKRFVLLAGRGFEIKIPEPTHSRNGENGKSLWKSVKHVFKGLDEPSTLKKSLNFGGPQKLNWHIVRELSQINLERMKHLKPGGSRFDIPDYLRPDCHKGKNEGFSNVYARMHADEVSPTITGGCTVMSKGRFGHPFEMRTISVREAARIQTFPDSFQIVTSYIDHACQIIGNALPCEFARIMSATCRDALINYEVSSN